MYNTTCPHLFLKIFVDFLTSTLLRTQNTTLLSKVRRRFFLNFVGFSENPNFTNSLVFVYCRTSLFITISGLYGLFLVVVCIAFLASEVATHSVPLHYFEVSIMGSNPYKRYFHSQKCTWGIHQLKCQIKPKSRLASRRFYQKKKGRI